MFQLDYKSKQPIYEQLIDKFKQLTIQGILSPHDQLPSVRQLAVQITVNPNTVQKAYRELEFQGFIYTIPGKGAFVAPLSSSINPQALAALDHTLLEGIRQASFLGLDRETLIEKFRLLAQDHYKI